MATVYDQLFSKVSTTMTADLGCEHIRLAALGHLSTLNATHPKLVLQPVGGTTRNCPCVLVI